MKNLVAPDKGGPRVIRGGAVRSAPTPKTTAAPIVPREPYGSITTEMHEALREKWPDGQRLATAWRIAKDLDALRDLLLGRPVDPSRLDMAEVERARQASLVQLVAPFEAYDFAVAA